MEMRNERAGQLQIHREVFGIHPDIQIGILRRSERQLAGSAVIAGVEIGSIRPFTELERPLETPLVACWTDPRTESPNMSQAT